MSTLRTPCCAHHRAVPNLRNFWQNFATLSPAPDFAQKTQVWNLRSVHAPEQLNTVRDNQSATVVSLCYNPFIAIWSDIIVKTTEWVRVGFTVNLIYAWMHHKNKLCCLSTCSFLLWTSVRISFNFLLILFKGTDILCFVPSLSWS